MNRMHIFIDANVFLGFYRYTSDDLDELAKLQPALVNGRATLWLPHQAWNEFRRNRATEISASLRRLREQNVALQFPAICRSYDEYSKLRDLQKTYQSVQKELYDRVLADSMARRLKADVVIDNLCVFASTPAESSGVHDRARRRMERRDPPGKVDSLGVVSYGNRSFPRSRTAAISTSSRKIVTMCLRWTAPRQTSSWRMSGCRPRTRRYTSTLV